MLIIPKLHRFPLLLSLLASVLTGFAVGEDTHPNILIIITDDQGWGDLSLHGNLQVHTPNMDRLGTGGTRITHFYVQPVCSPTRAELLTGRYYPRGGVYGTGAGAERLDLDETTIADILKKAGYKTGLFGKWHNGSQYPYHPHGRGFDEFYGFTSGHWGLYFNPMIEDNGAMTRGNGYLPDDITKKTLEFITSSTQQKRPFFSVLSFNTPHSPMQVPDQYWERHKDRELNQRGTEPDKENPQHTRAALAMVENIDWNIGRIHDHLKNLGISENTLVVFLSDNGPNGHRWNSEMKGKKGDTDEGGVRSPCFFYWPGTLEAGHQVDVIGSIIDLLPTLVDLAGIQTDFPKPLDGISMASQILGRDTSTPERLIFNYWSDRLSVRSQQFRLDHTGQLFDISQDPGQTTNVASQYPDIQSQLQIAAQKWREEVLQPIPESPRPFTVGHPDYSVTFLPARDAKASGNIKRSNRWPNDSFFTEWTSTEDHISWDIEVLTPGLYSAEIWYACPIDDIGAEIELSFLDQSTSTRVHEPHNPPFLGGEYTRSTLVESPVKIFRRISMGSLHLQSGQDTLYLKALNIPGQQALEFRLLKLTRMRP